MELIPRRDNVSKRFWQTAYREGDCVMWPGASTFYLNDHHVPIREIAFEVVTGFAYEKIHDWRCARAGCVFHDSEAQREKFAERRVTNETQSCTEILLNKVRRDKKPAARYVHLARRMRYIDNMEPQAIATELGKTLTEIRLICRGRRHGSIPWEEDVAQARDRYNESLVEAATQRMQGRARA